MPNCKHCGTWAGIVGDSHVGCANLAEKGWTNEQIIASMQAAGASRAPVKPLTGSGVFWAVFGALWLFSVTAGILYSIIRLISL
jgi:hypothetical protein